jgi:allantoate deiminase
VGSSALVGSLTPALLAGAEPGGETLAAALARMGGEPGALGAPLPDAGRLAAFLELHIEQGPVLEAAGLPVGVVTAINGASRYAIEIDGVAGHAGTVPMALRQDAMAAAAECVLAVERRADAEPELVGTVGKLECLPGAVNVVPGMVRFTMDVRAPRDDARLAAAAELVREMQAICDRRGVHIKIAKTHEGKSAPCAGWLQAQIGDAIAAEGFPVRALPSGAGHDGMAMIDLADIGMLFVRCEKGISHNPAEAITLADAEIGARVFLRFIETFDPTRKS